MNNKQPTQDTIESYILAKMNNVECNSEGDPLYSEDQVVEAMREILRLQSLTSTTPATPDSGDEKFIDRSVIGDKAFADIKMRIGDIMFNYLRMSSSGNAIEANPATHAIARFIRDNYELKSPQPTTEKDAIAFVEWMYDKGYEGNDGGWRTYKGISFNKWNEIEYFTTSRLYELFKQDTL